MPSPHRKLTEGDRRGGGGALVPAHGRGSIGVPPHEFSHAIAHKVEIMAAQGVSQEVIAFANDVSVDTIRRHYKPQLEKGLVNANTRVTAAILQSAEGERRECETCEGSGNDPDKVDHICPKCRGSGEGREWRREPNTTAQIWWSKNRMGWTDKERIEHVGDGGGPVIHEMRTSGDTIKDRLAAIQQRLRGKPDPEAEAAE